MNTDPNISPTEACRQFLQSKEYAVIATVSELHKPLASTIMYLMDENWNIFFCTRETTMKARSISEHSEVALAIGHGPEPYGVQLGGNATLLTGEAADAVMTNFMIHRNGYYTTFLKFSGLDFAVYKITPTWLHWIHPDDTAQRELITQILPEPQSH